MESIPGVRRLFRLTTIRPRVAQDLDDEIGFHLDSVTEELVGRGLSPQAAREQALQRFGDMAHHRASLQSIDTAHAANRRRVERLADLLQDVRYTLRGLRREPLFTTGVALTLALGIAANSTMFGVIDRLLLRPPPHVRDDGRMTLLHFSKDRPPAGRITFSSTTFPDFVLLRDSSGVFDDAAAFWSTTASLGRGRDARKIRLGLATANFFPLLGTTPQLGRFYLPDEDVTNGTNPPVVISDGLWRRGFGGARDVLGRVLRIGEKEYIVSGVAPPGFNGPKLTGVDAWLPMHAAAAEILGASWETSRNIKWLNIVAHRRADLDPGTTARRATQIFRAANREARKSDSAAVVILGSMIPARSLGDASGAASGNGDVTVSSPPEARIASWLGAVAFVVLIIACANVANLLLARAGRRRREVAVRLALGVRRRRLVAQLLVESLVLSAIGGAGGLLLAIWGANVMRSTLLSGFALDTGVTDGRVLAFTGAAVLLTAVVAGLAPALASSVPDLSTALKSGAREGGGGGASHRSRLRRGLLVAQAALSVVLLVGAGLFVRSLGKVTSLDLGFDADRVLVASVDAGSVAKTPAAFAALWDEARAAVQRLPGVASASLSVTTPFESSWAEDLFVPGRDSLPRMPDGGPYINAVSRDYFATMGTSLRRGRGFVPSDVHGGPPVTVLNESMARRLWPTEDALGKCIKIGADTAPCVTVVGVSESAVRNDLRQGESAQYYLPLEQGTWDAPGMRVMFVRARGPITSVTAEVRDVLQRLRPDLPYADVRPMAEILAPEVRPWRLGAVMFGLFGLVALLVAAVGLYSVVAYDIAQRSREMGVRVALGARPADVIRLVLGEGLRPALSGIALGVGVALVAARGVSTLLFDVSPRDPVTYTTVAAILLLAAIAASLAPARRATRVAPADVLRAE